MEERRSSARTLHAAAIVVHASLCCCWCLLQSSAEAVIAWNDLKCMESERDALLSLKNGFVDPHGFLSHWEKSKNCCYWEEIECDEVTGHVVGLYLDSFLLRGEIAPSMADLRHLRRLSLAHNDFGGLTEFPTSILSLTKLVRLYLGFSNLNVSIPRRLGRLFDLQVLSLPGNRLHGGIPESMAMCGLIELDLSNNSLIGGLDELIASFGHCSDKSALRVLKLRGNRISGSLPDLSHLSSLNYLDLGFNELNGRLSESIGMLQNLTTLVLDNNSLQGLISESHFLNLSKLAVLDLSHNHLAFNVSDDWVPPFKLYSLRLSSCVLGPSFPRWLKTQNSCVHIDVSYAGISDAIPGFIWDLEFNHLNLSHNQMTGGVSLVPSLSSLVVHEIDLRSNLLEGPISSNLSYTLHLDLSNNKFTDATSLLCPCKISALSVLDLSDNHLSGDLPDCDWRNIGNLTFLSVANNRLAGELPSSMGALGRIEALHLGNNRFQGELPLALSKCTELSTLDVAGNKFSGLVPSWIGDELQKLRILVLRSNLFSGSLPFSICRLSHLQIMDLSMNDISGSLPKCLNHLSALVNQSDSEPIIRYDFPFPAYYQVTFSVSDIVSLTWKGKAANYQRILGLVKSIDFSSNVLTGEIPSEMMDLVGLVSLNLSRNMITGKIPTTIGQLKSLDFLDLSRNRLFGNIPPQLSRIDRLALLDLSYNILSGEIPASTQLQTFNASTYVANADLCGPPLPTCSKQSLEGENEDENSEDDEQIFYHDFYISFSIGFIVGLCGVCSLLFFCKSWRHAYFELLGSVYGKVYVMFSTSMAKLNIRNRLSNSRSRCHHLGCCAARVSRACDTSTRSPH